MTVPMVQRRTALAALAATLLAGCGGGGDRVTPGIAVYAGSTGETGTADGDRQAARFNAPAGVAFDAAGNLYVADQRNSTIRKITPSGAVSTIAGTPGVAGKQDGVGGAAQFAFPTGLAIDGAGNVIVADSYNMRICRVTPAGAVTTILTVPFGSNDGRSAGAIVLGEVAVNAAGNLYVTSGIGTRRVTPAGATTMLEGIDVASGMLGTAIFQPRGLTVDRNGTVYVADLSGDISKAGANETALTTLAGTPLIFGSADGTGTAASFNRPAALAADASGNVYIADTLNNRIRKLSPAGVVTTVVGPGAGDPALAAAIDAPMGIAIGPDGDLYVTTDNAVARITLPTP